MVDVPFSCYFLGVHPRKLNAYHKCDGLENATPLGLNQETNICLLRGKESHGLNSAEGICERSQECIYIYIDIHIYKFCFLKRQQKQDIC